MVNRLLGIVYFLLNKGKATASELAERFEVSERTIYRDIEKLSIAGFPIYAQKGKNGGILLMDNFILDKMVISEEEQKEILAALTSIQETRATDDEKILQKFKEFFRMEIPNWLAIDLSGWNDKQAQMFEQLREAILNKRVIEFDYYGKNGKMSQRKVEPLQLVYKEYTWYLYSFCHNRKETRLFKILRMKRINILEEKCKGTYENSIETSKCNKMPNTSAENAKQMKFTNIVLHIDKKEAYRIYDRFDEEEISILQNGDFQISICWPLDDWLYGLILSYGSSAKVISPEFVKKDIINRIQTMSQNYI